MPNPDLHRQFDARQAKEIGERLRELLGKESITGFAKRVGVSRQWLHDILSGRASPDASLATMSTIGDVLGYSWEWLVTGKGIPNDQWSGGTTLVRRLAPKTGARKQISLERIASESALVPTYFLTSFEADLADLGVLRAENIDLGPLTGPSDEVLVDLKDRTLIKNGLFIAQVRGGLLACRAIKADSVWVLSPTESLIPESLIADYRILGRIRLIWKRV
jgi:transcriptional regulator with XRE-family HTH domain